MDKEEIRKNRERVRKQMKACFVTPTDTSSSSEIIDIKKIEQDDYMRNRRRRKTSQDIRISDDITFLKEMFISNSFNQLFQIKEKIGEGAQSTVYTCKQIDTQTIYAVKIIDIKDPQLARKQKQQFKILKTLDHQNIIKAFYLFINQIQSTCYLILEYCPYGSLKDFLKNNPHLKQAEIAIIIKHILDGLVYIHKNHACHRDIKPENILYNHETGQLKLIDFQIAKITKYEKQRLQMWTKTGTPQYKAPEMLMGEYNQLVDIWALGVLAYQMLFKKLPFSSDYDKQLQRKILQQQPNYSSSKVTQGAVNFLKRLLEKNPLFRLTSSQVLKTPFLLKYTSNSGSTSPYLKKKRSSEDQSQIKVRNQQFFAMNPCHHDDQSSKLNAHNSFSVDIGIRVVHAKITRRNTIIQCQNAPYASQTQLNNIKPSSESPQSAKQLRSFNQFAEQLQDEFYNKKTEFKLIQCKKNNSKSSETAQQKQNQHH